MSRNRHVVAKVDEVAPGRSKRVNVGGRESARMRNFDKWSASVASAAQLPEVSPDSVAFINFTSGTTSRPKGVLHAQRVVRARDWMRGDAWEGLRADDTTLHAGTLNWSYTMGVGLMDPWRAGAHAVLCAGGVEPAAWPGIIERFGVTVFAAVLVASKPRLRPSASSAGRTRALLTGAVRAQSGHIGVPHDEHERRVSRSGCQWHRGSWIVASRGSSVTRCHGIPPTAPSPR